MGYSEYDKRILPPALLIMIVAVALLAFLLRRKSERVRAIPTAIIAVLLLVIEVVKQRWNIRGEFDLFFLPFHYCSLFFIVIPLAELFGKQASRIFRPIATCMSFMVSVAMYVCPNGIIGNATETLGVDFKETHGFIFHHLILLYFLLVVAMRLCNPRAIDAVNMGFIGLVYASAVFPLSVILDVNYCNFRYSVIPWLETLRLEYGQELYVIFVIFSITVGAMLSAFVYMALHYPIRGLLRRCFRRKKKNGLAPSNTDHIS